MNVTVNDTTNTLSKRIIFGDNHNPQNQFNYRNLALPVGSDRYAEYLENFGPDYKFRVFDADGMPLYRDYIPGEVLPEGWSILPFFPGYKFGWSINSPYYDEAVTKEVGLGKSVYLGEVIGEGGRVYSEPGPYTNVLALDISSQHPASIDQEMLFGPKYTPIYTSLRDARIAIKHRDFIKASKMFNGALIPYLNEEDAPGLAQALKIVINSVYGLTKASFKNEFRDPRNEDNIVAKRGALFMTLLKREVQKRGFTVCHIKTDCIKIPEPTDDIREFVINFGREYGYEFEVEGEFTKFCLLNDAAYIAKNKDGTFLTKATQFNKDKNPYVYKTLFSHEPILFKDMCETMSTTKGALYLDFNEDLGEPVEPLLDKEQKKLSRMCVKAEKQLLAEEPGISDAWIFNKVYHVDTCEFPEIIEQNKLVERLKQEVDYHHNYQFVGRVGLFCPVISGAGGGVLYRYDNNKYYAAAGTTGYRWLEAEYVQKYCIEDRINLEYYEQKVAEAIEDINEIAKASGKPNWGYDWLISDNATGDDPFATFMNIPENAPDELPWEEVT